MSAVWGSHAGAGILGEDKTKYVVMKRSPQGNRQWLNAQGKFVLLRAHAARFTAEQAAELLTDNAVMEVAP